ncbi:DUF4179 domain-containing protein [Clostridium rectalis]|uniref:DUF4179 domain-containing protein n=1 Tax=Clostridium rectalis TaxID=2040295 RepID=UPI000F63C3C8|nr:DUF4179 domain-containing protein [Clostridium rectalis]
MKKDLVDNILKNEFHKYTDDAIKVPLVFHNSIEDTLASLPEKSAIKKKTIKKYITAACIVLSLITITAFSIPTLAKNIPIINNILNGKSIFQFRNDWDYDFGVNSKDLKNYSNQVNKSIKVNGITITLKEVACDGYKIYVGYLIEGNTPLPLDSMGKGPDVLNGHRWMINDSPSWNSSSNSFVKINDKSYILKEEINLDPPRSIPKKFRFSSIFSQIGSLKLNFKFDIIVNQNNFKDNCKDIFINNSQKINDDKFTVKNLYLTPISSTLNMEVKKTGFKNIFTNKKEDNTFFNYYNFLITNENGTLLKTVEQKFSSKGKKSFAHTEFIPEEINTCKYIDIKLFKKHTETFLYPKDYKTRYSVPIKDIKTPIKITTKKLGSIIITKFSVKGDKLEFSFKTEGSYSPILINKICILDKNESLNDFIWNLNIFSLTFKNGEYTFSRKVSPTISEGKLLICDPSEYYEPLETYTTRVKINN